ncbi:hypothetical protein TrST_g2023 [Triparma strigata]|uniref:Uncharacterized protein n=1 Tax=Triparma strigata TaxID=1606541 RepID=A0A9W7EQN7_9STRA|nr:hypothetical protein TrST_g2023 [Triparma strigata]
MSLPLRLPKPPSLPSNLPPLPRSLPSSGPSSSQSSRTSPSLHSDVSHHSELERDSSRLPTPPLLPWNIPPLPSSLPSSGPSTSSRAISEDDSGPSQTSDRESSHASSRNSNPNSNRASDLGSMGKSLLSSNLSRRVDIDVMNSNDNNKPKPQDAGPAFYSATSRDLLRLIRSNQRALRATVLEIEKCKQTGQEALRICKLMQLEMPPTSRSLSSSSSLQEEPPPPPPAQNPPSPPLHQGGYEADADETVAETLTTTIPAVVPSELSSLVPLAEFDVRTPESSLPSRSTYFASAQALGEASPTLRSSLDYDPSQYRPTLEELLPHFSRLRQEARMRSKPLPSKSLPPQLPLYVSSPDPPPELSASPPKMRRSPSLQESHFRRTPKREASVMASMYVAPKLSPHRNWRERSNNAQLGCMRGNSLKRVSPPFVYDKPSFVGLPTKVEEEISMKRRDEAVGHPKRSAHTFHPIPPPNSPPRRLHKHPPHGHRKLYYSPYKGIAYGVASKKIMKFVTTLSNGSSSFESSGAGNNSFMRPISRPLRTGRKKSEVVRTERVASEDLYWNIKPFRPGAVERRFLASEGVGQALTWNN